MIKFSVSYNNKVIKTYELDDAVITIGRLPENKICISNMGISRRHVKIERDENNNLMLIDMNSLNGTFVNNKKVAKTRLIPGDKIAVGKYTVLLESDEPAEPAAAQIPPEPLKMPEPQIDKTPLPSLDDIAKSPPIEPVAASVEHMKEPVPPGCPVLIETNKHVVYKLDKQIVTLGASESNDIFVSGFLVNDGCIEIERSNNDVCIRSNKFVGKFKVNGNKKKSHILRHKDRIEIGSSVFRFMENG